MYSLKNLFTGSNYKSSQFTQEEILAIEEKIFTKNIHGKETLFIKCLVREKEIQLKPEEAVRQLFLYRLINSYGYKISQIKLEHAIKFGRETKRADIAIFETDRPTAEYIIVEVKKPKLKEGKEQLKSYCNATGATMGVWTNGESISYYHRKDPNYFEDIPDIPRVNQKLKDILTERWTIAELTEKDKLTAENKSLSNLVREMENEVLSHAGVDVFDEMFKLIFTKLYDEFMSMRYPERVLEFRNYGDTDADLKKVIQNLFDKAKDMWSGIFSEDEKIKLMPSPLAISVSSLQNVKLFNSNLEIIDDAFEYLMTKSQKGEKGQYFTPRYIIDMCVKMLNPKSHETMIDTAAGSCGFPVHTIFHVWKNILREKGISEEYIFNAEKKTPECEEYVNKNVFAMDFDEKAIRVAWTLNLIAGDGKTNVLHLNTLDYDRWEESLNDDDWKDAYYGGWKNLRKLRAVKDSNREFNFDIVMANPPFAGDIEELRLIARYELGKNSNGGYKNKITRDVLFIERNLQFLKPGGRMAIVLPQGRFNNSTDKYVRDFISERCRILAVVGLHGNVFKPHTGTKTSVLFVQKWDDKLCPYREKYPIFFATMQKPSKDNSGEKIYIKTDNENFLLDKYKHRIIDHDLFNHDGLTQDGIAEAFIEFAKKEKLSFFDSSSFDEVKYKKLLEELECAEVSIQDIDSNLFRLEAEYYSREYLSLESKLSECVTLEELSTNISCGPFGSNLLDSEYTDSGVLVVRPFNLKNFVVEDDNLVYISEKLVRFNNLKLYEQGTLLFSRVGDIKIGMLNKDIATISPNLIAVKLKNKYLSKFLAVFFNTRLGFAQIKRELKIMAQPTISTDIIKKLKVPIEEELVAKVTEMFDIAQQKLHQAQEKFSAAEKVLSESLGLENFKPSTSNIAIKDISESFGATGRLDAEFYLPKYEDIENKISESSIGKVKNFFAQVKTICDRKENFYNYVEIGDINISTGAAEKNLIATKDLPDNAKIMTQAGDILISKVRPNRGAVSILRENNLLVSGAFTVLRATKNFSTEVLQILLRLPIYKEFMLKFNVGTSYPVIKDDDILNLPLPEIKMEVQEKISTLVEESFKLREESEKLLEQAKILVEQEIEK